MEQQYSIHRKMLTVAISSLILDQGIDTAEKDALGTLTEILQCCKYYTHS